MFAILVGTCDKYAHLWDNFVLLFNKYWDDRVACDKYFLAETVAPAYPGFKALQCGRVGYSEALRIGLEQVPTDYILWLQDDYFFRRIIIKERFDFYAKFIARHNVDRFGLCEDSDLYSKTHVQDSVYRLNQHSEYTVSMQASIWKREFFLSCLGPPENPWQFEIDGSARLNSSTEHNIYFEKQDPPWYKDCMRGGKYNEHFHAIAQKEGLCF
jgi:hypothetical protein